MIKAIIWDYDETLVDTRLKNLNVTRLVMNEVIGNSAKDLWGLKSLENYVEVHNRSKNWMELYKNEFGLTMEDVDFAGTLWTKYQLEDSSSVTFFDGIENAVRSFAEYPQGIVSQNSLQNISKHLSSTGMSQYFGHIIGYEEVPKSKQKPHPEGLLSCISAITILNEGDTVIYIGDHESDSQSAYLANEKIGRKAVVNIGVFFSKPDSTANWSFLPDYILKKPSEIPEVVKRINNVNHKF